MIVIVDIFNNYWQHCYAIKKTKAKMSFKVFPWQSSLFCNHLILWKETLFFCSFKKFFIFKFCLLLQAFDQDAEFHFKNRARQCDKSYWKEKFGTGELYAISSSGTGKNVCAFSRNLSWFAVFLQQPILLISYWNSNFFFTFSILCDLLIS